MEEKDIKNLQVEILKHLSQVHREMHNNRINNEMKVVISTVTLFLVVAGFLFGSIYMLSCTVQIIVTAFFTTVLVLSLAYLFSSMESNRINQNIAENAEDLMLGHLFIKITMEKLKNCENNSHKNHPSNMRWCWQAGIIFITYLLVMCGLWQEIFPSIWWCVFLVVGVLILPLMLCLLHLVAWLLTKYTNYIYSCFCRNKEVSK